MGIIVNACTICMGGLLGSLLKGKISFKSNVAFAISVMLMSAVGMAENLFSVSSQSLSAEHIVPITLALIVGCLIGDKLKLEERLSHGADTQRASLNAFMDATMFFGIGGLQICGPILLALRQDSSQLYLKSLVDFPFALMMGMAYGAVVMLSALPVALCQLLIAVAAFFAGPFMSDSMLRQLCSFGYILLFFTGFNMICLAERRIKNINMIPGILFIILWNLIVEGIGKL